MLPLTSVLAVERAPWPGGQALRDFRLSFRRRVLEFATARTVWGPLVINK